MSDQPDSGRVRLAELVAALSLGIDLGFGQPMEHVLRQTLIALRLAERMGLTDEERADVYYAALLVNVGCHTDAHEQAKWAADDIAMKSKKYAYEPKSMRESVAMLRGLGAGGNLGNRLRVGMEFAMGGYREVSTMIASHARLARQLGEELGLSVSAVEALGASYEWWDGKGWPGTVAGEQIPPGARIALVAEYVEVAQRTSGTDAAVALARRRAGKQFDPEVVAALAADPAGVFAGIDLVGNWAPVIDLEPALTRTLSPREFDAALTAIANFVDLKSPFTLGHSGAVSRLSRLAAQEMGWTTEEQDQVARAGLVIGFGRLGVSNAIWDKPGPLGVGEWERVRMYPYFTERMLRQSSALAPLGRIAVEHREHLDGSGYPRGLPGNLVSRPARLVGVASAYQAMSEPRPYREALAPDEVAAQLRTDVREGRLDASAVDGVLAAAGHRPPRRREGPGGLTAREVEVLVLAARGLSTKQIAERLVISTKTAANHIEHIYAKIGATNRSTASLFAVQHGLLPEDGVFTS